MKIDRKFTIKGESPYKTITFKKVRSEIKNPDGSVIFKLNDVEVPAKWSQVATDIIAQKYFRKKDVKNIIKFMKSDKKNSDLKIKLILINKIGKCLKARSFSETQIIKHLNSKLI